MNWGERAIARGTRAVEQRRARLVAAVAGRLGDIDGLRVTAERGAVMIEGRGLAKRWLEDSRLRFAGDAR